MIATQATKAGVRYRYYLSQPSLHGEARTAQLGSVSRVPAPDIEQAIVSALGKHLIDDQPRGEIKDEQIRASKPFRRCVGLRRKMVLHFAARLGSASQSGSAAGRRSM
jgi:hypothetical protein